MSGHLGIHYTRQMVLSHRSIGLVGDKRSLQELGAHDYIDNTPICLSGSAKLGGARGAIHGAH